MQICKECANKFKYKEIMKSIWLNGYAPIVCVNCDTKYHVNFSTRLIVSLSISLPVIINGLFYRIFYNLSYFSIIIYLIWISISIGITPFYARYHTKSNDEQDDGTKALLTSNLNRAESEIIISILESYEIPYLKKSNETKNSIEICAEYSNNKIDIYVPPDMLQMAKELTNHSL